jgi:putative peptidoglycan lipid II flippase
VHDNTLMLLLGLGTTAGIVTMTVVLWPPLRAAGVKLRWRFRPRDPAVRKVASLSRWTLGYVAANQIALTIALALANRRDGDVTAYTYAFVFFQLPYGLFAVSIMTTFAPELASAANQNETSRFRERFALGARLITLVVLPASVGYILLARPLVSALLAHGSFGGTSPILTADLLADFAIGLIGFSLYLYALRGFYALHDTRTPFLLNLVENGVNIVLAFALVGHYGVQGVAFSYSVAYLVAAVLALAVLRRRVGRLGGTELVSAFARIVAATTVMAAAVWATSRAVGADRGTGAVTRVVVGVLVGTVVYAVAALALRVDDLRGLRDRLLRR